MDRWISNRDVAARLGVTVRTVFSWSKNPKIGFPQPAVIGGRRYFSEEQFEEWRTARLAGSDNAGGAAWGSLDKHVAVLPPLPKRRKALRVDAPPFTDDGGLG